MFQFGCILIRNGVCCFKKCLCKHSWLEGVFFLDTCRWHWVEIPLLCWQRVFDMIASLSIRHAKVTISFIFCERHPHFVFIIRHTHRVVLQHSKLQNPHTLQMPTSPAKTRVKTPSGARYTCKTSFTWTLFGEPFAQKNEDLRPSEARKTNGIIRVNQVWYAWWCWWNNHGSIGNFCPLFETSINMDPQT